MTKRTCCWFGEVIAIAVLAVAVYAFGGFRLVDNGLHDLRMRTQDVAAGGNLVIVEIDAPSLQRLEQWPWPRGHHAIVLDRLLEAGAERIAFDVSFSSPSVEAHDNLLAAAAARAGDRLILPIFRQPVPRPEGGFDTVVDRPIPALMRDANLASINVRPDGDGIVRSMNTVERIDGQTVPSMATALLGGVPPDTAETFLIDFAIDIRTLPRVSFADVLTGQFDPAIVQGRSVLVGASAIELGDMLTVPRWGNLPGPLVIATGYESLAQGRTVSALDALWFVLALCLVAAAAPGLQREQGLIDALVPAVLQIAGLFVLAELLYAIWSLKLDLAPVMVSLLVAYAVQAGRHMQAQSRRIAEQNREVARRQALLRSVVDTSIDAVLITDRHGVVLIANPACLAVFGRELDDLAGRDAVSLISPADPFLAALLAMVRTGSDVPRTRYPVDVTGTHADGSDLDLELALASIEAEQQPGREISRDRHYVFLFRDVSEKRRLETMRRFALESQVEAERSKADFLATASHELRTPLNHIKGFTSLLESGIAGALSEQQRDYVAHIETASDNLLEIVTDILNIAQAGQHATGADVPRIAVGAILDAARSNLLTMAESRDVSLLVDRASDRVCALLVLGTPEELGRALMHVIRNAVQFSKPGGEVVVSAAVTDDEPTVQIAVSDRGPGMTAEEIEQVLRPFGQLEAATSRHHGGMGIGLNVTRSCVERHGGRVTITSQPGSGTTVTLALRLADPDAARDQFPSRAIA